MFPVLLINGQYLQNLVLQKLKPLGWLVLVDVVGVVVLVCCRLLVDVQSLICSLFCWVLKKSVIDFWVLGFICWVVVVVSSLSSFGGSGL